MKQIRAKRAGLKVATLPHKVAMQRKRQVAEASAPVLLLEDGSRLLLESGGAINLEYAQSAS